MKTRPPHVLLIMTDQQRGDCLGIERHACLQTPALDHLAARGTRFTRAYTTCPSCVPARRSLMSGQHPLRTGMVGYQDGVEWERHPPLWPQVLRDAGYQTALIGRNMHLHPPRKRYGFEHQVTCDGPQSDYGKWLARHGPEQFSYHSTGPTHNDWTARTWPLDEAAHPTNWTVTESLKWLERRDPTAPFFLTVQFLAPHPPLVPPAFYFDRYLRSPLPEPVVGDWASPPADDGLGQALDAAHVQLTGEALRSARAAYYALINHIDDQIHRLLQPFFGVGRDKDLANDTLVIFTSDHGEMLGDHHLWRKIVPYEASARVPMIVVPPRRLGLPSNVVCDRPVCLEDLMPTAMDFAGVPVPSTVDGHSLAPFMRAEQPGDWRSWLHVEHAPQHQTLTDGREKYIWWVADGREQFFDLTADPHEQRDLARGEQPDARVAVWRQRLVEQLATRPEGFSDGRRLVPGRPYRATLEHVRVSPDA